MLFLFIDLLFAPIRAACADDSNGFVVSIGESHGEQPLLLRYTNNDKAIFLCRVQDIAVCGGTPFVEHSQSFQKGHSVLAQVCASLNVVPFKTGNPHTRCS